MKPETRDTAGRILGLTFFSAFAAQRICFYITSPGTKLADHFHFVVVTLTFLVIAASYLFRAKAKVLAKGFMETLFPFIPAGLPLAVANSWWLAFEPWKPYAAYFPRARAWNWFWGQRAAEDTLAMALLVLAIAANALVVWSLIKLRHSFSIMSEARPVVMSGPYRFVRHPIYTGEILATAAMLGMWYSIGGAIFFAAFVVTQTIRAFIEERKLMGAFPEYALYRNRTGMFFPGLIRGK
jgi:protein-S-isoprenylcysteine O-methyltransferase Ste14